MTARGAGFLDRHAEEAAELRCQLPPDPDRQPFGRRILQTFEVIEQIVVESVDEGIDGVAKLGEIDDLAEVRIDGAADGDLAAKRMTVGPPALVSLGYIRQEMRCLESKVFDQFHDVRHRLYVTR